MHSLADNMHPGNVSACNTILNMDGYRLLRMMSAAITPGIQPARVSIKTIRIEPHPSSRTARGGKIMASKTRRKDISILFAGKINDNVEKPAYIL
jgi:hypothetical protein